MIPEAHFLCSGEISLDEKRGNARKKLLSGCLISGKHFRLVGIPFEVSMLLPIID